MAETTYSYTIVGPPSDFPNDALYESKLKQEIEDSTIATALLDVGRSGDVCNVVFADTLPAGEKTTLDNDASPPTAGSIIGDHDGVETPNGSVTTTDATVTELASYYLEPDSACYFRAMIAAVKDPGATDRASFARDVSAVREGTGDVAFNGDVLVPVADQKSDAAWDVSVSVSGASLIFSVKGKAATTVNWASIIQTCVVMV